ncbi:hypothetical protein DFH11DRAFT_1788437 [Phellopilus nigrolimitatus]|nr:hypothetical protein DFH11DRAFT_1788437 [Phellopilus nigrolimitatus]
MQSDEPIFLNAYNAHVSSGPRFFQRNPRRTTDTSQKPESELLKSIRAALHGSGKDPDPPFRSTTSPAVDGFHGEEDLTWNEYTVVQSLGGVLRQSWDFTEEGQRVQYACSGWLLTEGTVHPSGHGSGSAARYTSNEEDSLPFAPPSEQKPERDPFNPFFRARKARMKMVEPPTYARGVFIFLRSFGKVFLTNGLEYTFSLPFIVHRAWPLVPHGVLVERVVVPAELDESNPLPSLYSLTNPFQEPRPIGLTEGIKGGYEKMPAEVPAHELDGSRMSRNLRAEAQIVWIAPGKGTDDIFVTTDSSKKKLFFWRYVYKCPKDIPVACPATSKRRMNRRGPSLSGDRIHPQMRMTSHSGKDMVARSDRIREPSPEFEPTQAPEFPDMPPLSALPGMAPTLSSTTTLASLASAGSVNSQWPPSAFPHGRRSSLTRNDLSSTMDRMKLGRRSEAQVHAGMSITDQASIPYYWAERLYEHELTSDDSEAWTKITISIFDHRFDGKKTKSLLALCLPASKKLEFFSLYLSPEDHKLKMQHVTTKSSVLSAVSIKATRRDIWDLLVLKRDSKLTIMTFDLLEIPVQVNPEASEVSIADVSMRSFHDDGDLPMTLIPNRPKIVALCDPLVSTVSLVYEDGSKSRLSVALVPSDEVMCRILQVLSVYCKSDDFFNIQNRFLRLWCDKHKSSLPAVQFDCFAEALLGNWGISWHSTEKPDEGSSSSPWVSLTSSPSHFRLRDDTALLNIIPPSKPPARLSASRELSRTDKISLHIILTGLHILGEEMRLAVHTHEPLLRLSTLTLRLAQLIRPAFSDLLKRLYPSSADGWITGVDMTSKDEVMLPLDVSSALYSRLAQPEHKSSLLEATANRQNSSHALGRIDTHATLRELTQLFTTLSDIKQNDGRKRAEAAVLMLTQHHIGLDYLSLLPLSISAPLREAARTCQLGPPPDWPVNAYEFVGRTDLTESGKISGDLLFNDGYRSVKDHLKTGVPRKTFRGLFEEAHRAVHHGDETVTGVELEMTDFTDVRFGHDRRMQEVARMLRSSNIPSIRMIDRPDLNEHEFAKEQQMQVLRTAERTLALPIGRAMFTFATVPSVTREMYTVPKIELTIRLQPQNICIGPEPGKMPADALHWAEFHNGVAAALRISPAMGAIDSSWISFNRPADLTAEHAGFLFGLGLTGHLKEMLTWHTFGYLTPKHELTSIGVLLGLAAANIGNGNKHVTKLLAVHTPALLPSPDVDLNVPLTTQAAGLVGVGLLYMGSKNRRMAEVALHQISRPDLLQPDLSTENREAYTMAAALSFGMIMLGRGAATTSPADVALLSRLRVLIHGEGPSTLQNKSSKKSFDVNLASPAATMALGLMYLKTERQDVADILTIPDSVTALNHIQPNFLLVRTIARNLIMWDRIKPTREWLLGQVPPPIMKIMSTRLPYQVVDDAIELAYYHITSGAVFALALKYAGTASHEAYAIITEFYEFFRRSSLQTSPAFDHRIKRAATRDGLSLVTLSMGIVMVGTGEISCLKRLRLAHGMYNQPIRYGSHMATHMAIGLLFLGGGRFSLGNSDASVACMIAAFYPHFPALSSDNRAYLPALRHLWVLAVEPRCLIARDVDTKEVVYLPMKIRVKEENGAVGGAHLIAPTLIPGLDRLQSIKVDTPRYWPFLLDIANNPRHMAGLLQQQTLFVKRRTMFLSYLEDPKGSRSLFVRSGMSTGDAAKLDFPQLTDTAAHPASDVQHYITSHSNDVSFIAFADRFSRADGVTEDEKIFNAFCHAALLDCIIQDKPQMLSSYLALYRTRLMSPRSRYFQLVQQDLLRLEDFYGKLFERRFSGRAENITRPALLRENSVSGALLAVDKKLRAVAEKPEFQRALRAYVENQFFSDDIHDNAEHPDVERSISWYLQRHAVPYAPYFPVLRELAMETLAKFSQKVPPEGTMGTRKIGELEQGVKLVLHASVTGLVRPFGSWSIESLNEILRIWQSS